MFEDSEHGGDIFLFCQYYQIPYPSHQKTHHQRPKIQRLHTNFLSMTLFGVYSEIKSEFWHGTLWGESPLLGKEEIIISEVVYKCGDFIYYYNNGRYLGRLRAILRNENDSDNQYVLRVQKTLDYDHLPGNFKGSLRQSRSHKEVWLKDEFIIIKISQLTEKANVMIGFQHQYIPEDTLQINEIIYKHNGHWCIRDAKFSYQHPADYIKLKSPPPSMKVYKLFLDLYFDDFGTYRNVYHSLGGIYLQFGNMPAYMRKQIKNHFVLGFVPFGGTFNEFIKPFVVEMKKLEQGKIMKIQGEDSWIIASLSVITADLPQGNDLTGVLRHGANKGCRTCTIKKELLTDYNQDIVAKSRYHHITNEEITKISQESVISIKNQLGTKYGLRLLPSILDQLKREKHLQTPQDIYHSTAGKIGRLLKITCELFSQEGKENFIKIWKDFEKPKKWPRLPNPINHHASFMMSDYLRIAMIIPYILYRFLKISSLKENGIIGIQQRINAPHNNLIIKSIISCWVHVAKTMKAVFNSEFTADEYNNLQKCLQDELIILSKVFASFENLPNLHVNMHLLMHAQTFGTLINTQVGIKEMVHRVFKGIVPKTNRKNIDLDLLRRYNTLFAIRHLADGGIDPRFGKSCASFTNSNFSHLFSNWYITDNKFFNKKNDNDNNVTSPVEFISNISLKRKISKQDRDNLLSCLPNFNIELQSAYDRDLGVEEALTQFYSISWYEFVSYTIEETNGTFSKIQLHLNDYITINDEDYGESYAVIKGIFRHKGNNGKYYAFIVIDWFKNINQKHSVLECPLYQIQGIGNQRWKNVKS
ncbi:hypothetical protein RhiirB3_384336 [Rhizophagus irregularis]|nr:hypothetical protein RhiirB3_384336 [Rhizophagus irregularis]